MTKLEEILMPIEHSGREVAVLISQHLVRNSLEIPDYPQLLTQLIVCLELTGKIPAGTYVPGAEDIAAMHVRERQWRLKSRDRALDHLAAALIPEVLKRERMQNDGHKLCAHELSQESRHNPWK